GGGGGRESGRPGGRGRLRLVIWILAVALAAAFAATLPATTSWPLPAGLGGVVGDAELRLVAMLTGVPLAGLTRFGVAAATGIAGLTALALACGFGLHGLRRKTDAAPDDAEEDERVSISRGVLAHG